jgi:hypothetical protein
MRRLAQAFAMSKFNVTAFPVKLVNNTVDQLFWQIWRPTAENSSPDSFARVTGPPNDL